MGDVEPLRLQHEPQSNDIVARLVELSTDHPNIAAALNRLVSGPRTAFMYTQVANMLFELGAQAQARISFVRIFF